MISPVKDFANWNKQKILLESQQRKLIVKKRQIWLFSVGVNIGNEESKNSPYLRPGLIINNYMKGDLVLIVPITSKYNEKLSDIYHKVSGSGNGLRQDSYVLLNQFKIISKKRLIRKLNDKSRIPLLDNEDFLMILDKLKKKI